MAVTQRTSCWTSRCNGPRAAKLKLDRSVHRSPASIWPRYLQVLSAIGGQVVQGVKWLDLVEASLDRRLLLEAIGREKQWWDWRKRVRGSYSVIRELPDGTVWQVDERRMPSGVVIVWTDVSKLFGRTRHEVFAEAETARRESYLSFPHETFLKSAPMG